MKIRKDCKCDCGHTKEKHFSQEGSCSKCACTWFYPNMKRIKKNKVKIPISSKSREDKWGKVVKLIKELKKKRDKISKELKA